MLFNRSLLITCIVVGLGSAYCARNDFATLRSKMFASNAEVMTKDQVIQLLNAIRPLTPASSTDNNDLVQPEIDALLAASVLSDERCVYRDRFVESFSYLRLRRLLKITLSDNEDTPVTNYNKNIINYANQCEKDQFEACAIPFKANMKKVSGDDSQLMDELTNQIPATKVDSSIIRAATEAVISPRLNRSQNKQKQIGSLFVRLINVCDRVIQLASPYESVVKSDKLYHDSSANEETNNFIKRVKACQAFEYAAKPDRPELVFETEFYQRMLYLMTH